MKLILAFLASFLALVSAIAIDADLDNIKRELDEITADGDVEIYSTTKDNDGLDKLVIFVDGVFEGTLVQTDEYNLKAFDADGNEIDVDELLDEDNDNEEVEKRWISIAIRVLRLLAPAIKRYGSKALKFFKCMGLDANLITCANKFSNCATMGTAPWKCLGGISCMGKVAKSCAKSFK